MTDPQTAPAISRGAWWTLAITASAGFMVSMEITVIALAFNEIQESFAGTSRSTLSWIFTAYNIGVAAFLLVAGWAADRFGRKKLFLIGLTVFIAGSLGSGFSSGAGVLIGFRVLQSIGGAMQFPAGLALLLPAFPPERRGMAIGIWGMTGALAAALGPSIGAFLINAFNWRAVFLVNVPIGLVAIVLGYLLLEESVAEDLPRGVDMIGVPVASIAVGLLVLVIVQGESWGWASAPTLLVLVASVVLLAVFVLRSRTHPAPLFDLDLFRIRSFSMTLIGTVFFCAAFFGWFVVLPSFVLDWWGYSIVRTGLAVAPGPTLSALISPFIGRFADQHGYGPVLVLGGVSGACGMVMHLLFTTAEPRYVLGLLIPGLFVGVAAGSSFAMLTAAAMRDIPPRRFGMAGAGRTTVFQLAVAIGIAVSAAIVSDPGSRVEALSAYRVDWAFALVCFALQAVVFGFFYPAAKATASSAQ